MDTDCEGKESAVVCDGTGQPQVSTHTNPPVIIGVCTLTSKYITSSTVTVIVVLVITYPLKTDTHFFLPYFDLYNATAIEKSLTKCLEPNLTPEGIQISQIDEALIYSPREVLILQFM